jgi:phytoene dehydrogenase-like protein
MMVMVPTLHDPALAPKGKSVVILQCAASMRSMDRWGTRNGKRTGKYRAYKKEIARQLIMNAEQLIPELSSRIEVQIESTPFTLRRYTLNSAGASVGWTAHPRETFRGGLKGLLRSGNTPIRNLYQVGHWTLSPGGAPAALMTGKIVSSVLRQRLRWGI